MLNLALKLFIARWILISATFGINTFMTLIIADRVQETTNTTGTGALTLNGAIASFRSFSTAIGNGNTTYYSLVDGNGIDWEVGIGTIGAGSLTRTSVLASSNANSAISLSAFTPHFIFSDAPAVAIQLISSIANNKILANISGLSGAPSANSLSDIIDATIGSTQGDILYRNASGWVVLAPGTSGQVLVTQGASANPLWSTFGLSSLPTVADGSILANISGSTAAPSANTLTAIIDHDIDNTQGDILYRGASSWSALAPGSAGQYLRTAGAAANPAWASIAYSELPTIASHTVLSNVTGSTATPSANSVTSIIDIIGSTQGQILYRGASSWSALATGTSGFFLQTQGASANPIWAVAVTSVATGTGLTGGTITSTGTISFASVADSSILANISGGSAAPIANTLTAIIDYAIANTQGDILYRGASSWSALAPGTSGQVLTTQGASANPVWSTFGFSSLPTMANNTILSNISGITATPTANTLSDIIDSAISSTQGVILYRGASTWSALAVGTTTQFLQSGGVAANPVWATAVTSVATGTGLTGGPITTTGTVSFASISNNRILANVSGSSAAPTPNTLTDIIDTIGSTQGQILYRGSSTWTVLSTGTSGQYLKTFGAAANPGWASIAYSELPTITDGTILANISGSTTTPSASTLTAIIDYNIGSTRGQVLYRGTSAWNALSAGTSGYFLQTQGAGADPIWASIASGGLGSFPTIADGTVLSNISGGTASPAANTLSAVIDYDLSGTAQGNIIYRGSSNWTVLAPGTAGKYLRTAGAAANPAWASIAYSELPSVSNNTIISNISGGSTTPSANSVTSVIDTIGGTQGQILYRGASAWSALSAGTSGAFLMTQGASANPTWQTIGYSNLPTELQNSFAVSAMPGLPPTNSYVMIFPIVQSTQLPANFAGSSGYCFTNATGSFVFTVGYVHSGTPTTIGTVTFSSGGGSTPAFSTQSAVNMVSGDVLYIHTQTAGDGTLSDVGISLELLKQ